MWCLDCKAVCVTKADYKCTCGHYKSRHVDDDGSSRSASPAPSDRSTSPGSSVSRPRSSSLERKPAKPPTPNVRSSVNALSQALKASSAAAAAPPGKVELANKQAKWATTGSSFAPVAAFGGRSFPTPPAPPSLMPLKNNSFSPGLNTHHHDPSDSSNYNNTTANESFSKPLTPFKHVVKPLPPAPRVIPDSSSPSASASASFNVPLSKPFGSYLNSSQPPSSPSLKPSTLSARGDASSDSSFVSSPKVSPSSLSNHTQPPSSPFRPFSPSASSPLSSLRSLPPSATQLDSAASSKPALQSMPPGKSPANASMHVSSSSFKHPPVSSDSPAFAPTVFPSKPSRPDNLQAPSKPLSQEAKGTLSDALSRGASPRRQPEASFSPTTTPTAPTRTISTLADTIAIRSPAPATSTVLHNDDSTLAAAGAVSSASASVGGGSESIPPQKPARPPKPAYEPPARPQDITPSSPKPSKPVRSPRKLQSLDITMSGLSAEDLLSSSSLSPKYATRPQISFELDTSVPQSPSSSASSTSEHNRSKLAPPASKALKVLGLRAPRGRKTLKNVTGQVYELTELHEHLVLVHKLHPSALTGEIMDYSERVLVLCEEPEIADFNRIRFLVSIFQPTRVCKTFQPPCKECKRPEEVHPWKRDLLTRCREGHPLTECKSLTLAECAICKMNFAHGAQMHVCADCQWHICGQCAGKGVGCLRFVSSHSKVCCLCGGNEQAHPLEREMSLECVCNSVVGGYGMKCLLKQVKTYLAYGLWDVMTSLLQQVGFGSSPEQKGVLKWLFALMFCLVSACTNPQFVSCSGGRNIVTSFKTNEKDKVGGKGDGFAVISERYDESQTREIAKTYEQLTSFCFSILDVLRGEIDFPELQQPQPQHKPQNSQLKTTEQSTYAEFIAMLTFANSYRKVFQISQVREKFLQFFDLESSKLSLSIYISVMQAFFQSHRKERSLPSIVLEMLCFLLIGVRIHPQYNIITSFSSSSVEPALPPLVLTSSQPSERWVLPLLFEGLTVCSDEAAIGILKAFQLFVFRELSEKEKLNNANGQTSGVRISSPILNRLQMGTDSKLVKILGISDMLVSKLELCAQTRSKNEHMRLPIVFAHHMCQTLIQERGKFLMRAVTNVGDAEIWTCLLNYANSASFLLDDDRSPTQQQGGAKQSLHQVFQSAHESISNSNSSSTSSSALVLLEHSEKLLKITPSLSEMMGDFNRLRLLVSELYPITKTNYRCSCNNAVESGSNCLLAFAKNLVANGIFEVLLTLSREYASEAESGNSSNSSNVEKKSLLLQFRLLVLEAMWILGRVSVLNTSLRCMGKTYLRISLDSFQLHTKTNDSTIKIEDVEYLILIESNARKEDSHKLKKSFADVRTFCETIVEMLKEEIFWPSFPKLKSRLAVQEKDEMPGITIAFTQVIDLLNATTNIYKVFHIEKAREMFVTFFEIDSELLSICRNPLRTFVSEVLEPFRFNKTLPRVFLEMLVQLLCGTPTQILHAKTVVARKEEMSVDVLKGFPVPQLIDGWMLSLILDATMCVPNDTSLELLRNISLRLVSKVQANLVIVKEPMFQSWFLPVLFEHEESSHASSSNSSGNSSETEEDASAEKGTFVERAQLSVHIFSCIHAAHILCHDRSRVSDLPLPEDLYARGIAMIAGYASNNGSNSQATGSSKRVLAWSPKTIGLSQVFAGSVLNKFAVSGSTFQRDINHCAWDNLFACLNVYRNLTWCPMPPRTNSQQEAFESLVSWLLSSSSSTHQTANNSQQVVMEHTVAILCNFLAQLKFFDLVALPGNLEEEARVRTIQASGLGFMSYFRDLLGCLGTARKQAPEARDAVIRHFFTTYHFSRAYSKDEVDRVRALDENEARRRRTLMSREASKVEVVMLEETKHKDDAVKKQRVRDFEALERGVTVWNMSDSSASVQQCYLYLKKAEKSVGKFSQLIHSSSGDRNKSKRNNNEEEKVRFKKTNHSENDSSSSSASLEYNVVIETAKRKVVLALFDQTQVYLGSCVKESLGELEYARDMCVQLRWKKGFSEVKTDFGCTSSEDFETWARCVAFLAWSRNEVVDMGEAVGLHMWLHARTSSSSSLKNVYTPLTTTSTTVTALSQTATPTHQAIPPAPTSPPPARKPRLPPRVKPVNESEGSEEQGS